MPPEHLDTVIHELTPEQQERLAVERRRIAWVQSVHEMIADEPHPHGVRVSVQPSRETEGAAEIHLFAQSPYHATVVKVPAGAQNVEGLYGAALMQHER